ncbi:MAG: baseplate J/gp47 family protein [Gammaproteobacteria bacterium]
MSLPALQLDDLTWSEMTEAVRNRIIAHSQGQWTMHGPVDPGVSLLELFAYLFEQRLYWLDQVPASQSRALLALLNDAPLPTQAARTVLGFAPNRARLPERIHAGTLFRAPLGDRRLPMTSLEPVSLLPLHYPVRDNAPIDPRLSLLVDGQDRTTDLENQRPIELLPSVGQAGEFQLIVWLDRELDASEIDGSFNLLLDLDTAVSVGPEWAALPTDSQWFDRVPLQGYEPTSPGNSIADSCGLAPAIQPPLTSEIDSDPLLGEIARQWAVRQLQVAPPAELTWSYSTGPSTRRPLSADRMTDGTGGLRRPGVLRIRIPSDWQPLRTLTSGPIPYALWAYTEQGTYSAPPLLRRVVPNVAIAQQLESVGMNAAEVEKQLAQWLKLPGQQLLLDSSRPEPLEDSVRLELLEVDGQWHRWRPTDDVYRHGPNDRVFVVDRARKAILFGDGFTARVPALAPGSQPRASLCYLAGGGACGNVVEQQWRAESTSSAPLNVTPAIGGRDAETITEARARVARDLQRVERAVTAADYETLALATPGVAIARAHAAIGFHPGFPCQIVAGAATVFVLPEVPRPSDIDGGALGVATPLIDPGALREVSLRLDARRLLSHEVYVRPVPYRAVFITVELQGLVLDEAALSTSIERQLSFYLDPLVGGEGDGWPFGEPLRPTDLLHQVQGLLGEGVTVTRIAISLDDRSVSEDCRDVPIRPHELVYVAEVSTTIERVSAMRGGLR